MRSSECWAVGADWRSQKSTSLVPCVISSCYIVYLTDLRYMQWVHFSPSIKYHQCVCNTYYPARDRAKLNGSVVATQKSHKIVISRYLSKWLVRASQPTCTSVDDLYLHIVLGCAHEQKIHGLQWHVGRVDRCGQQNTVCNVSEPCQTIWSIMKSIFRQFRWIRFGFKPLRCL